MKRLVVGGWVNFCGGGWGTPPAHIRALKALESGRPPRAPAARGPRAVSGIEVFYPADDNRPLFVGERTNVIGSRRFQEPRVAHQLDEDSGNRRALVRDGPRRRARCLPNPPHRAGGGTDRLLTQAPPPGT